MCNAKHAASAVYIVQSRTSAVYKSVLPPRKQLLSVLSSRSLPVLSLGSRFDIRLIVSFVVVSAGTPFVNTAMKAQAMIPSKAMLLAPAADGFLQSTYLLGSLGMGVSAWVVYIAGLSVAYHSTNTLDGRGRVKNYDDFAFSWLLPSLFVLLWIAIFFCWYRDCMGSASRILTPSIAVLLSWFGTTTQTVVCGTLKAFKVDSDDRDRYMVWAAGCVACCVCLAVVMLIVASWESPHDTATLLKTLRSIKGAHKYRTQKHADGTRGMPPSSATGSMMHGMHHTMGSTPCAHGTSTSDNKLYVPTDNMATIPPFPDAFQQQHEHAYGADPGNPSSTGPSGNTNPPGFSGATGVAVNTSGNAGEFIGVAQGFVGASANAPSSETEVTISLPPEKRAAP